MNLEPFSDRWSMKEEIVDERKNQTHSQEKKIELARFNPPPLYRPHTTSEQSHFALF